MGEQPTIRVFRHLARSGGTMFCKCLASMKGVALLSEVHPRAMRHTNPAAQAQEWLGLISRQERARFERPGASLADLVALVEQRALAKGRTLLLREWSHIDYVGVPFAVPTMKPALVPALAGSFGIVETASVRHPLDQWLSLDNLEMVHGRLSPEAYLRGCAAFAGEAARVGFVRFEDLTRDPDATLRTLCERLGINFDPSYRTRWFGYDKITGDRKEHASRGSARREIKPLPRREPEPALLERFRASDDYLHACETLGYEP